MEQDREKTPIPVDRAEPTHRLCKSISLFFLELDHVLAPFSEDATGTLHGGNVDKCSVQMMPPRGGHRDVPTRGMDCTALSKCHVILCQ